MSGAAGSSQWMYASGGYEIENSVRLDGSSGYLKRTPSSSASTRVWTFATWIKRSEINNANEHNTFLGISSTNNPHAGFRFQNDALAYWEYGEGGTGYAVNCSTLDSARFLDCSAWAHVMLAVNTTHGTNTNRVKIYWNGVLQTLDNTNQSGQGNTYPDENQDLAINSHQYELWIGGTAAYDNFDGYLADTYFINNQQLTPSDFGETGDFGEFKPIEYEGSFDAYSHYLNYSNSSDLGEDSSGNSNTWSVQNLSDSGDQMLDTPTNNFSTMNVGANANGGSIGNYDSDAFTVTEGNLKTRTAGAADCRILNTLMPATGKWYFEFVVTELAETNRAAVSVGEFDSHLISQENQAGDHYMLALGASGNDRLWYYGNEKDDYNYTPATGDIWQFAFDITGTTHKIWIRQNAGNWFGTSSSTFASGSPAQSQNKTSTDTLFYVAHNGLSGSASSASTVVFNFGQDSSFAGNKTAQGNQDSNSIGDFYYTPPTGFLALCTKNLPAPAVTPSEHFNALLYTGTGSNQDIDGVGFRPDFVWAKNRTAATSHMLTDSVRGVYKTLNANNLTSEGSLTTALRSFNSNGFSLGSNTNINTNTNKYVSWNWKAGGAGGSSNTNGDITSTVSANTDAGFSIVSWTGNETVNTVGHGLSKAPEVIIIKNRERSSNWITLSTTGADAVGYLNETTIFGTSNLPYFFGNGDGGTYTAPTSSVFTIGGSGETQVNASGEDLIAYCFHSVDGFSRFGNYIGNSTGVNGTFVYTGFRPALVIMKDLERAVQWYITDDEQNSGVNSTTVSISEHLQIDNDSAHDSPSGVTYLSNGFKIHTVGTGQNYVGERFIYLAFAAVPFKYANAF